MKRFDSHQSLRFCFILLAFFSSMLFWLLHLPCCAWLSLFYCACAASLFPLASLISFAWFVHFFCITCLADLLLWCLLLPFGDSNRIACAPIPEASGKKWRTLIASTPPRLQVSGSRFCFCSCCISWCYRALACSLPLKLRSSNH